MACWRTWARTDRGIIFMGLLHKEKQVGTTPTCLVPTSNVRLLLRGRLLVFLRLRGLGRGVLGTLDRGFDLRDGLAQRAVGGAQELQRAVLTRLELLVRGLFDLVADFGDGGNDVLHTVWCSFKGEGECCNVVNCTRDYTNGQHELWFDAGFLLSFGGERVTLLRRPWLGNAGPILKRGELSVRRGELI